MKKILTALLALSAASFAFAATDTSSDKAKCDDKCDQCTKACCSKDGKACADAKESKPADAKKGTKPADPADKK